MRPFVALPFATWAPALSHVAIRTSHPVGPRDEHGLQRQAPPQRPRGERSVAERQLVMVAGSIFTETTATALLTDPDLQQRFLGVTRVE